MLLLHYLESKLIFYNRFYVLLNVKHIVKFTNMYVCLRLKISNSTGTDNEKSNQNEKQKGYYLDKNQNSEFTVYNSYCHQHIKERVTNCRLVIKAGRKSSYWFESSGYKEHNAFFGFVFVCFFLNYVPIIYYFHKSGGTRSRQLWAMCIYQMEKMKYNNQNIMQDYHYPPNCRGIDEFHWKQRERSGPRLSYPGNKAAKNAEICLHWVSHSWYFLSISAVIWLSLQPMAQQGGNPEEKQQGLTELPTLKGILQLSLLQGGKEQPVERLIVSMVRYFIHPTFISPIQGDVPRPNPHQG